MGAESAPAQIEPKKCGGKKCRQNAKVGGEKRRQNSKVKNVLPYNPNAYIDSSKNKEGYEVPFTRLFYKFEAPASSESIFEEIKELEAEETILMKELFGNA